MLGVRVGIGTLVAGMARASTTGVSFLVNEHPRGDTVRTYTASSFRGGSIGSCL